MVCRLYSFVVPGISYKSVIWGCWLPVVYQWRVVPVWVGQIFVHEECLFWGIRWDHVCIGMLCLDCSKCRCNSYRWSSCLFWLLFAGSWLPFVFVLVVCSKYWLRLVCLVMIVSKVRMLIVKIVFGLAISGVLFPELRLVFVCGCVEWWCLVVFSLYLLLPRHLLLRYQGCRYDLESN